MNFFTALTHWIVFYVLQFIKWFEIYVVLKFIYLNNFVKTLIINKLYLLTFFSQRGSIHASKMIITIPRKKRIISPLRTSLTVHNIFVHNQSIFIYNIALFILDLVKKVESSPAHPAKMTPNKTPFSPKATFEAPTPRLDPEGLSSGPKPVIMTPASQSMSDPDKSDYDEMNDMKGEDFWPFLMIFWHFKMNLWHFKINF